MSNIIQRVIQILKRMREEIILHKDIWRIEAELTQAIHLLEEVND